ncbi:MAG: AMP-binding protein, partial [bacterium]|nr:AMP-binding protein [bacterium]
LTFDLSVFEIWSALSVGGEIIVVKDILELIEQPDKISPTLINTVPSAAKQLLEAGTISDTVRVINVAGEPLSKEIVNQSITQTSIDRILNLYGPSEDTTYTTYAEFKEELSVSPSIGRPIDNKRIFVLDSYLRMTPIGVPGELHIWGAGLARGYRDRPELTAEKFIKDPFSDDPESRLYKTGDLARYLPDGNIEYLGRLDDQVKIRGFRIELGEIEAGLRSKENVKDAVVIAREDEGSDKRIVAYTVINRDELTAEKFIKNPFSDDP